MRPKPTSRLPLLEPRHDQPFPLWMVFPLLFVGVYLSHLTLLRLPYYWDEAGYYIPAAYDFFRTGALIPKTTLSNAHPPLPSIYLALWWKLGGFVPSITRTAMCVVTALALLAVYRICLLLTSRIQVAVVTVVLTAVYPVWFAQSTLAHADLPAAAATLWALSFVFQERLRKYWLAALFFSIAALCKETSIATPLALAALEIYRYLRTPRTPANPDQQPPSLFRILLLLSPILPLGAWYLYHYSQTGFVFGNPEYLRYNAVQTLTPLRFLLALAHRLLHVTAHMDLFVPVLFTVAAMMLKPLPEKTGEPRPQVPLLDQARIYIVIAVNVILFSVLGGALLTRYLLPLYPLIVLVCVNTWRRRVRYWLALAAVSIAAFLTALFFNPPYRFAPEDNLAYADVIRLHQAAIRQIVRNYPHSTVLTAWPGSDELTKPELGYVRQPVSVVAIQNFSLPEIQKAAHLTEPYTVGFIFSTKYDPPNLPFNLGPRNEALNARFFDFHHDLPPESIAHFLGGNIEWRAEKDGQWAAVLHFDRPQLARLDLSPVP